jgi:hypothetical protein
MKKIRNFILVFLFLFPSTNLFAGYVTFNQVATVDDTPEDHENDDGIASGIEFNKDGTKMFISYGNHHATNPSTNDIHIINEYNLTTPYDISTRVYAGDSERCTLGSQDSGGNIDYDVSVDNRHTVYDLEISNDGMKLLVISRKAAAGADNDKVYVFNLTSPYDISTCTFHAKTENLDSSTFTDGSNAGDFGDDGGAKHRLQSLEISNDGAKLFLLFFDADHASITGRLYEYTLSTPYDVSTLSLVTSAGIAITNSQTIGIDNPSGMRFSPDGKRLIITSHSTLQRVTQISLTNAFDTSSFVIDGVLQIGGAGHNMADPNSQPRGAAFSGSGLKMYISSDRNQTIDEVYEYILTCPFNIVEGKCLEITAGDRTGLVEAQIEVANRTIEHSTDTALNRLKWIRRNKDLQNLSYQNIKLNFSNQMLASLAEAIKVSTSPKEKSKNKDIFYWAEGSLAFGKVRETAASSKKKIYSDGITIGADKFTDDQGIKGLALRFSQNDVSVGTAGSKLDADTLNLTYYSTTPVKEDSRFLDTIIGVGALKYDISSVLDGLKLNGNRNGRQIYGTLKLKEEIKKDGRTLIPAGQIDLGYTLLSKYSESGQTGIRFDKQSIQSKNLRLSLASVEELNNKKYKMKRHGKIEYQANLNRSSNVKYSYIGDSASGNFDTKFTAGALHNINGEVGFDIIYEENFSLFFIYEHNEAIGSGYTQKIHIAIGYLPQKNTNFAFKIEGDDILKSKYIYSKNVNGLDIDFYLLNNNAMRPETFDEIALNLRKVF